MMSQHKHHEVRTTLTLDDDVAASLRMEMRRAGLHSWKAAVNHFLRVGLTTCHHPKRKPFVVDARPLGLLPGLSYDNVEEQLEAAEGPRHK
ncbi:MAG TPA: hypothetical protein VL128_08245 [Candidatus Eisenbacteria bacterium]|nr:hypothetical protein [Candidatus Eisenbacteria bacterium]